MEDALVSELEEGERVETDDGYLPHTPEYVRCPASISNPIDQEEMQRKVRARHETCNKRFKQWGIFEAGVPS